jgi:hypothetical protein
MGGVRNGCCEIARLLVSRMYRFSFDWADSFSLSFSSTDGPDALLDRFYGFCYTLLRFFSLKLPRLNDTRVICEIVASYILIKSDDT